MRSLRSSISDFEAQIVRLDRAAGSIFELELEQVELAAHLKSGQFVNVEVPNLAEHLFRVPLSPAVVDANTGRILLVFAAVGKATLALSKLEVGSSLRLLGPSGQGWKLSSGKKLLVAGGIGAPPILSAAANLDEKADLILGARTKEQLWGLDLAAELELSEVMVATDDGTLGTKGFVTNLMEDALQNDSYDEVLACGPEPMLKAVAELAAKHELPCQVSLERLMGCGFGACNSCNVKMKDGSYKSCCMQGPVFKAEELAWD